MRHCEIKLRMQVNLNSIQVLDASNIIRWKITKIGNSIKTYYTGISFQF